MWRSFVAVSLPGLVVACSVYRASDLEQTRSGAAAKGGEQAAAGNPSGGGGSGGGSGAVAAAGAASGSAGAGTADGGSAGAVAGGESGDGGGAGEAGGGPDSGPDECPDDPSKRAPGECGCGIPDVSNAERSDCRSLKASLAHRYDFEGTGATVTDRVGTAHGVVVGAELSRLEGRGVVSLTGGSNGPYVDLPNGLVSSLTSVTVEVWLTWRGGPAWQRIFDFGDSTAPTPENNPAAGRTYLFATPRSEADVALASYSHEGNANGQQLEAAGSAPLSTALSQVVVVANGDARKLVLYVDGGKLSEQGWTGDLANLNDVNVWVGRSQYTQDPELDAVLHDFRIYDTALTAAQVETAYLAGADPSFYAADDAVPAATTGR